MFTTLRNAWKIPELRKKIIFTLIVMLIYRLGNCVPVPYVNVVALNNYFTQQLANTVLGLYNAMSGSAFSQATVFALGIQPYINASIIIELLTIALPAVTPVTADFKAMGTYTAPILGQIEAMEASITKIGIDLGLRNMMKLESKTIEIRWAQDVKQADGSTKTEGCKAFLRCVSKGIPGLSVDPGNTSENEATFAVSRYQLYVGGAEYWLIDQLNTILRVGGVDYAKDIRSLL